MTNPERQEIRNGGNPDQTAPAEISQHYLLMGRANTRRVPGPELGGKGVARPQMLGLHTSRGKKAKAIHEIDYYFVYYHSFIEKVEVSMVPDRNYYKSIT